MSLFIEKDYSSHWHIVNEYGNIIDHKTFNTGQEAKDYARESFSRKGIKIKTVKRYQGEFYEILEVKEGVNKMLAFNNIVEFQSYLRKQEKAPDHVKIFTMVFTMDSYDKLGNKIFYGNKKEQFGLTVITNKDRYDKGLEDAVVEIFKTDVFRNDVEYYE